MRSAVFVLVLLIAGGAAQAQQVISANPHRIEIATSCWGGSSYCQLQASDIAQGICHEAYQGGPRRALPVRTEQGDHGFFNEQVVFVFRCDRRSIICQAGSCN